MKNSTLLIVFLLFLFAQNDSFAQLEDKIYGVNNESPGVFKFAEVDLNTGLLTNLSDLPISSFSFTTSSAYNTIQEHYYLCTGDQILVINPLDGAMLEIIDIPFPDGGSFMHVHYDLCDRVLYGIVNNYPTEVYFAKYDFGEDEIYNLMEMETESYFCMGCQSVIDYDNRLYYYKSGNPVDNFVGISLDDYLIESDPTIVNIANESFGHIDLYCADNNVYGTSADVDESVKRLATVNKDDGLVEYSSEINWELGLWKPAAGGSCIDQDEGVFYYSGAGSIIVAVDIETANATSFELGSGEFLLMEHFSECVCQEDISIVDEISNDLELFPNPFIDKITIRNISEPMILLIFDQFGRTVSKIDIDPNFPEVDLHDLNFGSYFYSILSNSERISNGYLIKN